MTATFMIEPVTHPSPRFRANIALLLFLVTIAIAGAAAFVRWRLVVPDDAISTATNFAAHEQLFRMLLAADLMSIACYLAITLLFYERFKSVSQRLSLLAASLSFVSCAILAFGSLFHVAALIVLQGAEYLNVLSLQPLPALALAFLKLRAHAYGISLVFFGVYCVLITYLVLRTASRRVCI